MPLISITKAVKRFPNGLLALQGVNLNVMEGSFTVILGPSGAGKSTLLRMINGLERATSGEIRVRDEIVAPQSLRRIRGKIAMVFQQFNLVGRLSVITNVLVGRLPHRSWLGSVFYLFRGEDLHIAHQALARVGLTEKAWERADKLSGGQQQRVGIARALAQQPQAILADEPVASLDPVTSDEIMHLLKEICVKDGITIIVNLHQVELAERFADRVIGLNSGRIVFDGPPRELNAQVLKEIYRREGAIIEEPLELAVAYA